MTAAAKPLSVTYLNIPDTLGILNLENHYKRRHDVARLLHPLERYAGIYN